MSIHLHYGNYRDNQAVYDVCLYQWRSGHTNLAIANLAALIGYIEKGTCYRSRRYLLGDARADLQRMVSIVASKPGENQNLCQGSSRPNWQSEFLTILRKPVALVLYYAVACVVGSIVIGEVPQIAFEL